MQWAAPLLPPPAPHVTSRASPMVMAFLSGESGVIPEHWRVWPQTQKQTKKGEMNLFGLLRVGYGASRGSFPSQGPLKQLSAAVWLCEHAPGGA